MRIYNFITYAYNERSIWNTCRRVLVVTGRNSNIRFELFSQLASAQQRRARKRSSQWDFEGSTVWIIGNGREWRMFLRSEECTFESSLAKKEENMGSGVTTRTVRLRLEIL